MLHWCINVMHHILNDLCFKDFLNIDALMYAYKFVIKKMSSEGRMVGTGADLSGSQGGSDRTCQGRPEWDHSRQPSGKWRLLLPSILFACNPAALSGFCMIWEFVTMKANRSMSRVNNGYESAMPNLRLGQTQLPVTSTKKPKRHNTAATWGH